MPIANPSLRGAAGAAAIHIHAKARRRKEVAKTSHEIFASYLPSLRLRVTPIFWIASLRSQ